MSEYFYTKKEAEKAILVGVALQSENISYDIMCEYLDELAFLAETAGAETVKIFTQNLDKPVTATFIGKGKLEEINKAFRISKGTLKTLPIFHFTEQRIEVFCWFIAYKTAEDRLK